MRFSDNFTGRQHVGTSCFFSILWMLFDLPTIILYDIFGRQRENSLSWLQRDVPYVTKIIYKLSTNPAGCENLIDIHACSKSLHGRKLNTVACVVELTYLHIVVKCESLLCGTAKQHILNVTVSGEVILVTSIE